MRNNHALEFRELEPSDVIQLGDHGSFDDWATFVVIDKPDDAAIGQEAATVIRRFPDLRLRRPLFKWRSLRNDHTLQVGDQVKHSGYREWVTIKEGDRVIGETIGSLRKRYPGCRHRRPIPRFPESIEVTLTLAP